MKPILELPLTDPVYSTFHHQATSAIIQENPSIRNFYLNHATVLKCHRDFLDGYTSPSIGIECSAWGDNPFFEKRSYHTEFLNGYTHSLIRNLLNNGFYVIFNYVDDFYIPGKSFYGKRHFAHDGMICGYDDLEKTYTIYAYDENWVLRRFKIPRQSFHKGRKATQKEGLFSRLHGLKPQKEPVLLEIELLLEKVREHLGSSLILYPPDERGKVSGIAVHDYIGMYLDKLLDGSIPHERMDWRVFRLIWEHKKVMYERLQKAEEALQMNDAISSAYFPLIAEADAMRIHYAIYHKRKRNSLLQSIKSKLQFVNEAERALLTKFIEEAERKHI